MPDTSTYLFTAVYEDVANDRAMLETLLPAEAVEEVEGIVDNYHETAFKGQKRQWRGVLEGEDLAVSVADATTPEAVEDTFELLQDDRIRTLFKLVETYDTQDELVEHGPYERKESIRQPLRQFSHLELLTTQPRSHGEIMRYEYTEPGEAARAMIDDLEQFADDYERQIMDALDG